MIKIIKSVLSVLFAPRISGGFFIPIYRIVDVYSALKGVEM